MLATHLSFPEIGAEMYLSVHRIKTQARSIYQYLLDLPHDGPRPGQVAKREVDADELIRSWTAQWGCA